MAADTRTPMLCAADFEAYARQVLSREAWEFYAGGANDEQTLRDNVHAYTR
jgi:isopentenyl diphosphate isomerase/L-lactate dehydrogenase-like FMN-dependent dehydrogenase